MSVNCVAIKVPSDQAAHYVASAIPRSTVYTNGLQSEALWTNAGGRAGIGGSASRRIRHRGANRHRGWRPPFPSAFMRTGPPERVELGRGRMTC
jgi:hypothetical protein